MHASEYSEDIDSTSLVEHLATELDISSEVVQDAKDILQRAEEERDVPPAALYIACRLNDEHIPAYAFTEYCDSTRDEILSTRRRLCRLTDTKLPPTTPQDHIPYIANELSLSEDQRTRAMQLAEALDGKEAAVGRDPVGLAASSIDVVTELSRREITAVCGTTAVTIKKGSEIVEEHCDSPT